MKLIKLYTPDGKEIASVADDIQVTDLNIQMTSGVTTIVEMQWIEIPVQS